MLRLSDMIRELQAIQKEHGDIPITTAYGLGEASLNIEQLRVNSEAGEKRLTIDKQRYEDPQPMDIEIIIKENQVIKLRYDYSKMPITQAEGAIEVLVFKADVDKMPIDTFIAKKRTEAHKWRSMSAAFILNELDKDGNIIPHNDRTWEKILEYMNHTTKEVEDRIMECLDDFFMRRGMRSLVSQISQMLKKETSKLRLLRAILLESRSKNESTN